MIARLLKDWGGYRAGQLLSGRKKGDIPDTHAEYFEDDDPAVIQVREPSAAAPNIHAVVDNEVQPLKGSDYAKAQQAKIDAVQAEHDARQAPEKKNVGPVKPKK